MPIAEMSLVAPMGQAAARMQTHTSPRYQDGIWVRGGRRAVLPYRPARFTWRREQRLENLLPAVGRWAWASVRRLVGRRAAEDARPPAGLRR